MTKKLLGYCGVDSGQVLITDPCYIDSEWQNRDMKDIRKYQDKEGKIHQYRVTFENYESIVNGKTVNEWLALKEWTAIPNPGQLNYKLGHAGAGVVSRTRDGDGSYPVYGKYDKGGELVSLEISFK